MTSLPSLTEIDIRRWTGDVSFDRGRPYARDESIFQQRRQGHTLKAQCQGTLPQPYRVTARLGDSGIVAASCSCPVGGGGHCKHVAALLLVWLSDPAAFVEIEELDAALERREKPELIALIRQMIVRHPDLELLIELPAPGVQAQKPIGQDVIRRQVRNAFRGDTYEWGAGANIADELEGLVRIGDGYKQAGDWRNAATVYQTIAQEALAHYEEVDDEGGELGVVIDDCVAGLGECLDGTTEPAQRETLLRAIFDVYRWDVNAGGLGIGDLAESLLQEHPTPEERQLIVGWTRAAMPSGESWSDNFHRQTLGGLLLDLESDQLDDEAFLRICRETGRTDDLVKRLLALGRVDEALAAIGQVPEGQLLPFADMLRSSGQAEQAERLVRERAAAAGNQDYRLTGWLKERAIERGDLAEAQALAEALFWRNPDLPGYNALKSLAAERGTWEHLRSDILARLARDKQSILLTTIHLEEGEVGLALKMLPNTDNRFGIGVSALTIRTAQAAEERYPADAIRIYTEAAQRLIRQQGRENYATAAGYLARVRDLHQRLNEPRTWQALIADIRQHNKRLRALQEELTRAGL